MTTQRGIYLHVPFCHQACHYCDFHFSTNLRNKAQLVDAMCKEIELQANFFYNKNAHIDTVYFGGGTPSILNQKELLKIINRLQSHFSLSSSIEITFESNPEDLTNANLSLWKSLGINRLSIGIQSFKDEILKYLNRNHKNEQTISGIKRAQDIGFDNITIDLIYGIPGLQMNDWEEALQTLLSLNVPHMSAYCLTIEEKTAFGKAFAMGRMKDLPEDEAAEQFLFTQDFLSAFGWEQYEISNYAKEGKYSKHNSNYWKNQPYLGIGPSAHSFFGNKRWKNTANNRRYIEDILQENKRSQEVEVLSINDQVNEYILTSLRTIWGCDMDYLQHSFGFSLEKEKKKELESYIENGFLRKENQLLTLSREGKLWADGIALDFMV